MTLSINDITHILQPVRALHQIGTGNAGYQQCLAEGIRQSGKQVTDMTVAELIAIDTAAAARYADAHPQIEA